MTSPRRWRPSLSLAVLLTLLSSPAGRAQQREDPTWGNLMDRSKASHTARQYQAALELARAAEARARAITRGPDLTVALSLMAEGEADGSLGHLDAAAREMNEALTITRAAAGPRSPFVGTVLNMLSSLYFNASQFGKANDYLQQAIDIATAARPQVQAVGLGNMVWLQINLLDYPKALSAVERSLYQSLLRPLQSLLDKTKHVLFVPAGALESLPPAVLVTRAPPTPTAATVKDLRATAWLIRDKAITVVPSPQAHGQQDLAAGPGRGLGGAERVQHRLGRRVAPRSRSIRAGAGVLLCGRPQRAGVALVGKNEAAVALTTRTFAALAGDAGLDKAEALRRAILSLIDDPTHPELSHPSYWAPFVLVGGSEAASRTH